MEKIVTDTARDTVDSVGSVCEKLIDVAGGDSDTWAHERAGPGMSPLASSPHYSESRLRLREQTSLTLVSRARQRMSQEELLLTKLEKVDDDLVKITTTGDCFA